MAGFSGLAIALRPNQAASSSSKLIGEIEGFKSTIMVNEQYI